MVGPYAAWLEVRRGLAEFTATVEEFARAMNWQPQLAPEPQKRGPGRPRKVPGQVFVHPPQDDQPAIVTSVSDLEVPEDEIEHETAPPPPVKKTRTRRRASNGVGA